MTRESALKLLGLQEGFTSQQLKLSYRSAAKKYHPDKSSGDTTKLFQAVREAYDMLQKEAVAIGVANNVVAARKVKAVHTSILGVTVEFN